MTKCQYNYILCQNDDKITLNFLSNNKEDEKLIMEDFLCLETGNLVFQTSNNQYDPLLEELLDIIESEEDEDDDYYEITEGLTEGKEVVSGGYRAISRDLEDGKKVRRGTIGSDKEKDKDKEDQGRRQS